MCCQSKFEAFRAIEPRASQRKELPDAAARVAEVESLLEGIAG